MGTGLSIASLAVALIALLIALASAASTRRQAVAAEGIESIEADRWQAELAEIACTRYHFGHASVTVTLTVYARVMPDNQRHAADRFAALIEGRKHDHEAA